MRLPSGLSVFAQAKATVAAAATIKATPPPPLLLTVALPQAALKAAQVTDVLRGTPKADVTVDYGNIAIGPKAIPVDTKIADTVLKLPKYEDMVASRFPVADSVAARIDVVGLYRPDFKGNPILGSFQKQRYDAEFAKLELYDMGRFVGLLGKTKSAPEAEYLKKAMAAGHSVDEITRFADQIRGKSAQWLDQNLRLTGNKNGADGLTQQWNDTCAPTTAQVMRGEMDPIYSLNMRTANTDIHAVDPRPNATIWEKILGPVLGKPAGNSSTATEQKAILENPGLATPGLAVERGKTGGKGMALTDALPWMMEQTGLTYTGMKVTTDAGRKTELDKLDADLARGIPGALRISSSDSASGGHFVAVTGVFNEPVKTYVTHDPWSGKTVYVKASDLEKGNIIPTIAGWTHMTHVYTA
ncbi:MAG: hypothetical protein ACAI43_15865 [Phycisphaerae bacterium]|nr:hypothetical protein [Tepidisphaeraceae bacterium]